MGRSLSIEKKRELPRAAAAAAAVLCAWRLPVALGLPSDSALFAGRTITVALAAALYLLFRRAFGCGDRRLRRYALGLGLIFSLLTVVGEHLKANGGFLPVTWLSLLGGALSLALFALCYGAALALLFDAAQSAMTRPRRDGEESLFSRLMGNGFVVFALLLLCWLPAWLAWWPGTFVADSVTQFYQYMDASFTTHHPLLHTLLLGFCMMTGIDLDPEGSASAGLAVYGLVQMAVMAAILGYACWWMRRRKAPLWARVCVTVLFAVCPLYAVWSFSAQKDVLFGGFALLLALQLVDLWRDGYARLRSPLRVVAFVATAAVMMLLRNNGV